MQKHSEVAEPATRPTVPRSMWPLVVLALVVGVLALAWLAATIL